MDQSVWEGYPFVSGEQTSPGLGAPESDEKGSFSEGIWLSQPIGGAAFDSIMETAMPHNCAKPNSYLVHPCPLLQQSPASMNYMQHVYFQMLTERLPGLR